MDEQNTRRKLIEPFIEVLGWAIVSSDVELEYSVQMGSGTKRVDYALLFEETPVVFVEAKGRDSSISESNRRQLKSYMRQTGVDWGLLTNGTTFELFKRRTGDSRPDETSLGVFSQAGFDPSKKVVVFKEESLYELKDPIPFEGTYPQSLTYISLGELKRADVTDDLF